MTSQSIKLGLGLMRARLGLAGRKVQETEAEAIWEAEASVCSCALVFPRPATQLHC